jgi:hypothetical protein
MKPTSETGHKQSLTVVPRETLGPLLSIGTVAERAIDDLRLFVRKAATVREVEWWTFGDFATAMPRIGGGIFAWQVLCAADRCTR